MLVSCYRRGFRAPSCAQLLWKGRKGTKGGDARSARWAQPCPGTALPSPGNPAPAVPQAGPAGESTRVSPPHTRGRAGLPPAPPHGAANGPLHPRPIPVPAVPSPRLLTGPCLCIPSPFTGPHPGLPSRQRARLSPPPLSLASPRPPRLTGAGAACPAGTPERGAPAPPLPAARINNKMAAPERAGPGAGRHSNRAGQSPPRRPPRQSTPEPRPTGVLLGR